MGEKRFLKYRVLLLLFLIYLQANLTSVFFNSTVVGDTPFAQNTEYPYKRYTDTKPHRKEGITKRRELVSAEAKIELISAIIENPESAHTYENITYNLGFYLPEDIRAKVVVKEFEQSYQMELVKRDFVFGLFQFSWPSEIARYYDITLNDLFPLAKVLPSGSQKIIPVVLYTQTPRELEISYRFGIVPYSAVSVLEYSIYHTESLELIYSAILGDLRADREVSIDWNSRDQENNKVQNGQYDLVIEATFKPSPGTPAFKVTSTYHFYHYSDLLKELSGITELHE